MHLSNKTWGMLKAKEKVGGRGRGGLESLWCVKMNRGVVSIYFHEAKTFPWSFFSPLSKLTYHNFRNVFVIYSVKKRQFRRHKNTLPYNNAVVIQTGRQINLLLFNATITKPVVSVPSSAVNVGVCFFQTENTAFRKRRSLIIKRLLNLAMRWDIHYFTCTKQPIGNE